MRKLRTRFLLIALLLPALAACGSSKPTRLYTLTPSADRAAAAPGRGIGVGVGPVSLPKYLDRPQLMTRTAANSLAQADLDQWGGELNDNVTRVIALDLANLLGTDRVSLYPWKDRTPVDYQVTVDIMKFEQDTDGAAVLDAFWSLVNPDNDKVLLMRRSSYRDTGAPAASAGGNYDAIAAAMSRNLDALCRDIAQAIQTQKRP